VPDRVAEDDDYIGARFKQYFGSAPSLAWVVPPHRLITEKRHATPRTFASGGFEAWTYQATLPVEPAMDLRREWHVACESNGSLYEYSGEGPPLEFPERVLLIDSAGADVRTGLVTLAAEPSWLADGLAILFAGRRAAAHRDTAFSAAAGDEFYSFHAAYDTSASADEEMETHGVKYLIRRGLLLHGPGGAVIASKVTDVPAVECDGCGTPTITDDFGTVFAVLRVLRLPGFPHPVLLLNTGTVEGRALSLATFDEGGEYRSYRLYEYVVSCF